MRSWECAAVAAAAAGAASPSLRDGLPDIAPEASLAVASPRCAQRCRGGRHIIAGRRLVGGWVRRPRHREWKVAVAH
eukprot:scaffold1194_cov369-Prasinococcus_capsulatus_cf.AAC.6